jgi:hypothetical protein
MLQDKMGRSQYDKLPEIFVLPDIGPRLDGKEDEELEPSVEVKEALVTPARLYDRQECGQ